MYASMVMHAQAGLEATAKGYAIDSYCRAHHIDKSDMLRARAPPRPVQQQQQQQSNSGSQPSKTQRQLDQEHVQLEHDLRMEQKRLALDQARANRQALKHPKSEAVPEVKQVVPEVKEPEVKEPEVRKLARDAGTGTYMSAAGGNEVVSEAVVAPPESADHSPVPG